MISLDTRTSPAGAWGAEGFNAEGITLGNQSRSFLPIACFCGYFRCFELVSIISLGISRFSIVFSVFSHCFLWVPMHRRQPISFLYPNPPVSVEFPAVSLFSALFLGILGYFFVFWVLSSVFSMFSVGFRCISITLAATNRPDCALRLPEAKRHRQSFHQHTQIWSTNTLLGTNFDTTFLDGISIGRYLASCIPQNPCHSKRFPKLRSIHHVMIFLSLVFYPGFDQARFASVSEPVYSRALFQSELVQNGSRRA